MGGWAPSDGDPAVGLGRAGERREAGWVGPSGLANRDGPGGLGPKVSFGFLNDLAI